MIRSLENSMPHFDHWSKGDQSFAMAENTQARLSRSQSTDIVFNTQEGDKVTLSSSVQYQAKYATYESLAGFGGKAAWEKGESFEMSAASQFSLTIEGDLNAQEKADIKKALKTIDKIMKDLISGESDRAMERAAKLGRLDTLQSVSADLQVHEELYYEHQKTTMISAGASADESTSHANRAMPDKPSPVETAAVEGISEAVQASGATKGKLISFLNRYFSELEKRVADNNPEASSKSAMIDRVKSRLMQDLEDKRHSD